MVDELINFLKREGDLSFWKHIIFISIVSGIADAGILAVINSASATATQEGLNYRFFAIFIVLCLIFFLTKRYALKHASNKVEIIIQNSRDRISKKIINSELVTMEGLDESSVFTRLTRDTAIISQASFRITGAAQAIIMIFFAMIYILTISQIAFFVIILTSIIISATYFSFAKEFNARLVEVDGVEEGFMRSLNSVIHGFKELKINSLKRRKLLENHDSILSELTISKIKISDLFVIAMMYADAFLYTLLALIVFIIPHLSPMESGTVIKITAAMLFLIGPFEMVISIIPMVSRTGVAVKNIHELEISLDSASTKVASIKESSEPIEEFNHIKLKNTEFSYMGDDGDKLFSIGPIDLDIKQGETIFIIGGNGSGKSTLVKMLLGLYTPSKGEIMVDDEIIDNYNYQAYRDLFSIILGDFYLFDRFYGLENIDRKLVNKLLVEMELNDKTKFIDGKFTNINLSTGQKKRLALILSILEDKQIYVFDEWAADQDPEFRRYFYHTILKKLKDDGKTIIAVTHDDAYFDVADRVYKIDYGQISHYKGSK